MVATGRLEAQGAGETETLLFRGNLALRRRGELAGVEAAASGNRGEEEKQLTSSGLYSVARGVRERHAVSFPCQREAEGDHGHAWKAGERTSAVVVLLFRRITELTLSSFCKLLTNFLKKLKISKNESCSKSKVLQLCLNEHFQILPPF